MADLVMANNLATKLNKLREHSALLDLSPVPAIFSNSPKLAQ